MVGNRIQFCEGLVFVTSWHLEDGVPLDFRNITMDEKECELMNEKVIRDYQNYIHCFPCLFIFFWNDFLACFSKEFRLSISQVFQHMKYMEESLIMHNINSLTQMEL